MKKPAKVSALIAIGLMLFAFTTNTTGDGNFEGVITYSITMDGADANPQAAQMMQGSTIKISVKGDMSRTETSFGGMSNTIAIADRKAPNDGIVLMEMMGNKYQLKIDDKTKKEAEDSKPQIKYLTGTKTIIGYACKEAQATVVDKKSGTSYTSDIYYTDQLPYYDNSTAQFKGLKGFPLSYSMSVQGMNISVVAQSVNKQSIPDSTFAVPAGYKLVTPEEMQKDLMNHVGQ